jgi:hypothetical protein
VLCKRLMRSLSSSNLALHVLHMRLMSCSDEATVLVVALRRSSSSSRCWYRNSRSSSGRLHLWRCGCR